MWSVLRRPQTLRCCCSLRLIGRATGARTPGGDLKGEREAAESYLLRLQGRLTSATGKDVELQVVESEPAATILATSEKQQPDLIAMTTHGRSGLARWVLGSVLAKLLHATHTPILIVRPPADNTEREGGGITKILVPLDGSDASASVLPFAADLAKSLGARMSLFHALAEVAMLYPGPEAIFDSNVQKEMVAGARKYLTSTVEGLSEQGVEADSTATFGNTVDGIVWTAERENADLIVMSTHGRSGIGRVVLGSVADAVVRRTSLPVILVTPATNSGHADG